MCRTSERIRAATRDAERAEFADSQCVHDVLDVVRPSAQSALCDESGAAIARPVQRDDAHALLERERVQKLRLEPGAGPAMAIEKGASTGCAILADSEAPPPIC